MRFIIGFGRILIADTLLGLHRTFRSTWLGRQILRQCCAAFVIDRGLATAAVDILQKMGEDGVRLLKDAARSKGDSSCESLMLRCIQLGRGHFRPAL